MPSLRPGLRDVDLVPQRRFDQHVGRRLRTAGRFAAHDAGERFHAVVVGDHADRVVERVDLAVEREQRFAVLCAAHHEIALHLVGVEHMQRPAAVIGHVVGDIDQRIDRTQADRGQPLLQPFRRRAVLDAAHEAQREARARASALNSTVTFTGEGNSPLTGLIGRVLQLAHVGGGQIAGDAVDRRCSRRGSASG